MSTYLELSKTAQEQILATIEQGQELALAGVELWATAFAPLTKGTAAPGRHVRDPRAEGCRRELVRLRRAAARVAEGVRREGRRRVGAGLQVGSRAQERVALVQPGESDALPAALPAPCQTDDPWKAQLEALGSFIKSQRQLANLSLREMARLTDVSNAYLSQIERGLHQPSVRVLRSLADALNVSAETLLAQAGLIDEDEASERNEPRRGPGTHRRCDPRRPEP